MSRKRIIVVDIDGTIAQPGERLKYLQQEPKNWDAFYADCFDDTPLQANVDLVKYLGRRYDIIYCTGRRESARIKTLNWFDKYGLPYVNSNLLMRADGDKRHDTIAKPEMLRRAGINKNHVAFILEDRNNMVQEWRRLGFNVFQVAEGDF